jgi:hypothetical protein
MSTQPTADQLYSTLSGDDTHGEYASAKQRLPKGRHRNTRAENKAAKKARKAEGNVPPGTDPARHSREFVERQRARKLIGASQA